MGSTLHELALAVLRLFPLAWRLEVDKELAAKLRDQYQREGRGWIPPPAAEYR